MDKENLSENIIEYEYHQQKTTSENYGYQKNNNLPTSVTEIVECREQNTIPIASKIPNRKDFYISFEPQNKYSNNNGPINEEDKKIKIRKKDLNKIFKMSKIKEDEVDPYILFYFTSYKSEVVSNPMKTNKVDYRKLMRIIENLYIQFEDKDEIEIPKESIRKIFDLMGLPHDDRLRFFQFFGVDEESDYEEEENEEENINDVPLSKSKNRIKTGMINITRKQGPNSYYEIEKRTKTTSSSGYPEYKIEKTTKTTSTSGYPQYKVEKTTKTTSTSGYPEYEVEKRTKTTTTSGYPEYEMEKRTKTTRTTTKTTSTSAYPEYEVEKRIKTTSTTDYPEYKVEKRIKTTSTSEYPEYETEKRIKTTTTTEYPDELTRIKTTTTTYPEYEVAKTTKTISTSVYPDDVNETINTILKNNVTGNKDITIEIYKEQIIETQSKNQNVNVKNVKVEEEKNTKVEKVKKPKPIRKKTKVKIIGGNNNTAEKLPPSNLENLVRTINHIPSVLRNIKKEKLKGKKEIVKVPQRRKEGASKMIKIKKEVVTETNYEKEDELSDYENIEEEKKSKKIVQVVKSPPKKKKSTRYSFVLPKSFEHDNGIMYLSGSIPALGKWKQTSAIQMDEEIKNNQLFYTKYIDIDKEDFPFEYKFFYIKDGKTVWLGKPKVNYKSHPQYINLYENITENKNILSIFDLNIRYLNEVDGLNVWDNRKQKLLQTILKYLPDVLFFQEITRPQYDYMEDNLNSVYDNVGIYRDNTDHSEKCSISYNKIKYTMTDWGQFWLSSTPYTPGSNDFGNFFPRICTWVLLRQIDGEQFLCFNIHLDHVNFNAHLPCINVVINESEKILKNFPDTRMVFLGGCFYCEEDDELIYKIKQLGYHEIMFENTFHDFTGEADRHWDYMFWREISYDENTTITYKNSFVLKEDSIVNLRNQQFISDHYPVIAEFEIKKKNVNYNAVYNKGEEKNISNDLLYDEKTRNEMIEMNRGPTVKKTTNYEVYEQNEPEINRGSYKKVTKQKIYKYSTSNNINNNNNNNNKGDDEDEEEEVEIEEEIEENDNKEDNKENNNKKKENDEEEEEDEEKDDYKEENAYNQKKSDEKRGKKVEKEEIKVEKKVIINEAKNDDNNNNNDNEEEEVEEVEVDQEEEEQAEKKEESEQEEQEESEEKEEKEGGDEEEEEEEE